MKKKIACLLGVVMAVSVLGGCSGSKDTTSATGTGSQETRKETENTSGSIEEDKSSEASGEVTKVTFWNAASGEKVFFEGVVEEFNTTIGKENNVEIELEHVESATSDQELAVALQNGVAPDIFNPGSGFREYVEKGYLTSLEDIEELSDMFSDDTPRNVGYNVWQGKLYTLPYSVTVVGLAYNKDLFKAAGIVDENGEAKAPETIAEMVEDAKLLTDASKQQYGFGFPLGWGNPIFEYYVGRPAQSSNGFISGMYDYAKGEYDFSGIKAMAEAYLQMKEDGSMYPGMEGLDNDAARARFAEGNIAMMMTVSWDCAVWNDQFPAKCDWGVAEVPVENTDKKYLQSGSVACVGAINSKGIAEGRQKAIALVYKYLYGEDMLIRRAENGMAIPYGADVVAKCDFSNSPKGWSDYCKLANITDEGHSSKQYNLDGMDDAPTEFINKVWSGQESVDEFVEKMTKLYNEGIERFMSTADEDVVTVMNSRMDPNVDLSR